MKNTTFVDVLTALFLAALMSASAIAAEERSDVSIQGISVAHHKIKDNDGSVLLTVEAFYRGTNSILEVFTYQKAHGAYAVGGGCRIYRMNGKPVLIEDHKKPDGVAEFRVFGNSSDLSVFERFTKGADGSVLPTSSEELVKLKEQAKREVADMQALEEVLRQGVEHMKRGPGGSPDETSK